MESLSGAPSEVSPLSIATTEPQIRLVFTLVHGTWARSWSNRFLATMSGSVQWYEEGSTFRAKLASEFPSSIFCRSDWSGKNSIAARMEASKALAFELKQRLTDYPHAQHFIIAHSHGGNIVCYAFRDYPDLERQITGVITLSTPFLHGTIRTVGESADKNGGKVNRTQTLLNHIMLFLMMCGVYILKSTLYIFTIFWSESPGLMVELSFAFIVTMIVLFFILSLGPGFRDVAQQKINLKLLSPRPLLIIRIAADEASAVLLLSQLGIWLGNVTMRILMLPTVVWNGLPRAAKEVIVVMSCASLMLGLPIPLWLYVSLFGGMFLGLTDQFAFSNVIGGWRNKGRREWLEITRSGIHRSFGFSLIILWLVLLWTPLFIELQPLPHSEIFSAALIILSFGLMTVAVILTPFLACLSVGFKYMFLYMLYVLAVEAAPPGVHTIHQFGIRADLKEEFKTWFNHSIAYESGEVITAISAWVRKISLSS